MQNVKTVETQDEEFKRLVEELTEDQVTQALKLMRSLKANTAV